MALSPFSRDIRDVISWVSEENCDAEACELSDTLLAEGDRTLGFVCGDGVGPAGDRDFPLPRTRPPPSVLRDMILSAHGRESARSGENKNGEREMAVSEHEPVSGINHDKFVLRPSLLPPSP